MRSILIGCVLVTATAPTLANEIVYEGTWLTTNRDLDGTMTCAVTDLGDNNWRGHFYGVWRGVAFSYKVEFSGPPEKLMGTARVDGAQYQWTGAMSNRSLKGSFDGDRYLGSFDLKRKQ